MKTEKARIKKYSKLILASASPRRKYILKKAGFKFHIVIPQIKEIFIKNNPYVTVSENAKRKGIWCASHYPSSWIIAADTTVAFKGECISKPKNIKEAKEFLSKFSGKKQIVYTGLFIAPPSKKPVIRVVKSSVYFKELSAEIIHDYLKKVNPLDKAGAYDINQHGNKIISRYTGSYSNIMGLPIETIVSILKKKGFQQCYNL